LSVTFFYHVIEFSIKNLEIPYYIPTGISFFGDNFLGNLQYPSSPQYALAAVMGTGKFTKTTALPLRPLETDDETVAKD